VKERNLLSSAGKADSWRDKAALRNASLWAAGGWSK
jgi:hypothetical protein